MGTEREFQEMINELISNDILRDEFESKDYFFTNCEHNEEWLGGPLIVPFKGAGASSIKLGGLTPAGDIGQSKYVRGSITEQPEAWGSLIFNSRDLMEHGKISKQNLLSILPDEIEDFGKVMRSTISLQMTNGPVAASFTVDGTSGGVITVDRPERLDVGMKVWVDDGNSSPIAGYVSGLEMDTGEFTLVTTRFGSTAIDVSGYTTAQSAKVYFDGGQTAGNRFTSLKDSLLSAANGGSSELYGYNKLLYPYLQALNISGAAISAANILTKLFDAVVFMRSRAKGMANKAVMSYKHWGSIMKLLESQKGAYRMASDVKAVEFGWEEVDIAGPKGKVTVVAIQEVDDDYIMLLDMKAIKIYSNGGIKKNVQPDGLEYFTVRGDNGYAYIVDICFFGDLVLERPSRCGIIHSIPNYA